MISDIADYLHKYYSNDCKNIGFIGKGLFSSAYKFLDGDEEKIIRLNEDDKDFLKDRFAERFSNKKLPIPHILTIEKYNDEYYCAVSKKCNGDIFDKLSLKEKKALTPNIFETLLSICNTNINNYSGYGIVDLNFNGTFDSWENSLLNQENHKIPYDWNKIFNRDFFDVDLFNKYQKKVAELFPYLPKEKYLVHGDFGFDNLIVNNNEITGVIDWAEARLGDFLYDIAWLDFWSNDIRYSDEFKNEYKAAGKNIDDYHERLACYVLHIGIGSLAISGHFNNKDDYHYTISRIKAFTT